MSQLHGKLNIAFYLQDKDAQLHCYYNTYDLSLGSLQDDLPHHEFDGAVKPQYASSMMVVQDIGQCRVLIEVDFMLTFEKQEAGYLVANSLKAVS